MNKQIVLTFGAKKIGFRFGLYFVGELIEATGKDLSELMSALNTNPFKTIPDLMYYSAKYYSEFNGEEFELSKHQLAELIDDNGGFENEQIVKFLESFTASLTKNVPKTDEKPSKKK